MKKKKLEAKLSKTRKKLADAKSKLTVLRSSIENKETTETVAPAQPAAKSKGAAKKQTA